MSAQDVRSGRFQGTPKGIVFMGRELTVVSAFEPVEELTLAMAAA